jgi:Cu+-exporting ATPase
MTTETRDKSKNDMLTIGVGGMTCASCVSRVERALKKVPGVDGATVNLATEKATVSYDASSAEIDALMQAIEGAGYEPRRESLVFDIAGDGAPDVTALQRAFAGVHGIIAVDVSPESRRVSVTFPAGAVDARQLKRAAHDEGIEIEERAAESAAGAEGEREREQRQLKQKWIVAGIVGASLMIAGFEPVFEQLRDVFSVQQILVAMFIVALPIQIWAGWQFYTGTWKTARHATADMNTLIALGTTAAFVYSTFATFWPSLAGLLRDRRDHPGADPLRPLAGDARQGQHYRGHHAPHGTARSHRTSGTRRPRGRHPCRGSRTG